MTGLLTRKLRTLVGDGWATDFEARAEKQLAALRARHKAEIAKLTKSFEERLDRVEAREVQR